MFRSRLPSPLISSFLFLLLLGGLGACTSSEDNDGSIRFVHASPDAPALDLRVDDDEFLRDMSYLDSTDYVTVANDNHRFQVTESNGFTEYQDFVRNIEEDAEYTMIVTDFAEDMSRIFLRDDDSEPASGSVKLRIVHAAPTTPGGRSNQALDVYITDPDTEIVDAAPSISDLRFEGISGYLTGEPGEFRIRVTVANETEVIGDTDTIEFGAGEIRTVIIADDPEDLLLKKIVVLTDRS